MISKPSKPRAGQLIDELAANGRYHFTTDEMCSMLGVSHAATRLALGRLAGKGLVASPARGFHVIVPPEYRRLGCLPADQFIPDLMQTLGRPYYVALLSAAEYHGAAHQRPQAFQVALAKNRRPLSCGAVRIDFVARKALSKVPVQKRNTARGTIRISSPEATALDLVGYANRAGGLEHVATIIRELAERLDPDLLAAAARAAPVSWAQRLGYLLERAGEDARAGALKAHVRKRVRGTALLCPGLARGSAECANDWWLYVNASLEDER